MSKPVLNIVGCGRTARAVARCLRETGRVRIGNVVNRTPESANAAVAFIGEGIPGAGSVHFNSGDWLMIGMPDSHIETSALQLSADGGQAPDLAFHLSGGIGSEALSPLGCPAASVHPLRAFADPERAAAAFPGTWCVMEGDEKALAALQPVFEAARARIARLGTGDKRAYHAATVAASNFLVALNDFANGLASDAGLDPHQSRELLCDLQAGTLENIRALGPADALTGPIERGDAAACKALLDALPAEKRPLFRALGLATVALARQRDPDRDWDDVSSIFS